MKNSTIGKIARKAGIQVGTVRYYESIGLLPDPPRSSSGYRKYPPNTVERLGFIKRAKELGFTLEEVRDLLYLADTEEGMGTKESLCRDVRGMAEEKIGEIESKIGELKKLRKALQSLVVKCSGKGKRQKCPVIESLSGE